eukprot:GHVP01029743.1.p1 GENE.GHVP01029743.1~~GHVP01029743.1.p1  ORF type:complete len:254 (+),score=44.16 GHVP01029743.1:822-1583(+)
MHGRKRENMKRLDDAILFISEGYFFGKEFLEDNPMHINYYKQYDDKIFLSEYDFNNRLGDVYNFFENEYINRSKNAFWGSKENLDRINEIKEKVSHLKARETAYRLRTAEEKYTQQKRFEEPDLEELTKGYIHGINKMMGYPYSSAQFILERFKKNNLDVISLTRRSLSEMLSFIVVLELQKYIKCHRIYSRYNRLPNEIGEVFKKHFHSNDFVFIGKGRIVENLSSSITGSRFIEVKNPKEIILCLKEMEMI